MKFRTAYIFRIQEMPKETLNCVTEEIPSAPHCMTLQDVMVGRISCNKVQIFSVLNHFLSKIVSLPVKTQQQNMQLIL